MEPTPEFEDLSAEEWEEVYAADWAARCAFARAELEATGNPVFFWQLLQGWDDEGHVRRMRETSADIQTADMLKMPVPRPPLPEWAQDVLATMARQIMHLAEGRDMRDVQADWINNGKGRAALNKWFRVRKLEPSQRASLIPMVMGFTREAGWSAFSEFDTIKRAKAADELWDMLSGRWAGGTPNKSGAPPRLKRAEAKLQVMAEYGFTDDRAFDRFIRKGRASRHVTAPSGLETVLSRKHAAEPTGEV